MAKNLPNLAKDTNLQIKEADIKQDIPIEIHANKKTVKPEFYIYWKKIKTFSDDGKLRDLLPGDLS